jgi:hypothetical protein
MRLCPNGPVERHAFGRILLVIVEEFEAECLVHPCFAGQGALHHLADEAGSDGGAVASLSANLSQVPISLITRDLQGNSMEMREFGG